MSDPVAVPPAVPAAAPAAVAPLTAANPHVAAAPVPVPTVAPAATVAAPAPAPQPPAAEAPRQHVNRYATVAANAVAKAHDKAASLAGENAALKQAAAEASDLRAIVASHAATELAGLPSDAHRAAVMEAAGDDPKAQLKLISALKKHAVVQGALPVGATTTPPAPPAPGAVEDVDVAAARQHEELARTSPLRASQHLIAHHAAIQRGRQKLATRAA